MDVGAPDDALAMIAMRHPNDVRRLIGALRRIVARTKTSGGAVTAQLASEILAESETEAAA
jgi:chromosomal replication initiation ATPase DnaA